VWRRSRRLGGLGPADWAGAFAVGVFAFVLPSRVLSPQYLVWLAAPMAALADRRDGRRGLAVLVAAAALSQVIFPFRYTQLRHLDPVDIGLLSARNLLLLAACWLVARAFLRGRAGSASGPEDEQAAGPVDRRRAGSSAGVGGGPGAGPVHSGDSERPPEPPQRRARPRS
jgi:hypothetical protein